MAKRTQAELEQLILATTPVYLVDTTGFSTQNAVYVAKAKAVRRVNDGYDAAVATLVSSYPKREVDTFTKQEREAVAWLADNTAPTPFVDGMLVTRNIEKAELMNRIIAKADAFADATGQLTGKRQTLEKQIESATTVEEVEAIQW